MSIAVTCALICLAVVLLFSGAAKLQDIGSTQDAVRALRLPVPGRAVALALPWVEIVLGICLLLARDRLLVVASVLVLALLGLYLGVVVRALGFDEPVTCSCFGKWWSGRISPITVARNGVLCALAGVAVAGAVEGTNVVSTLATGLAAIVSVGVGALLVGLGGLLVAAGRPGVTPTAVRGGLGADGVVGETYQSDEYVRIETPNAVLEVVSADGVVADQYVLLRSLAATQARLVVFLSPSCGPCLRTMARLAKWSARLEPAVGVVQVYPGRDSPVSTTLPWYADVADNARTALGCHSVPSAVLVGADGMLAGGPVVGEHEVAELVDDILVELAIPGLAAEERPAGDDLRDRTEHN